MTPKPERSNTINIAFGAGVRPVEKQLTDQGYPLKPGLGDAYQRIADAITLLAVQGYLSESPKTKARQRLLLLICADARAAIEERK